MKNLKNQKGITLVALVVTIIVLLILAGVSLSLVAGSNGIITKASTASQKNTDATAKEQVTLLIAEWTTDFYEAVYVNANDTSVDVNQKAGDWIATTYPGTSTRNETTDKYKFSIAKENTNDYYTVTIYGAKATKTEDKDKRLSDNITGKLTVDGKLEWD